MVILGNDNELIQELVQTVIQSEAEQIRKKVLETPKVVTDKFIEAVNLLFKQVKEQQEQGKKGKLAYICFSTLYSDILRGRNVIRIDAYDKDKFLDNCESYVDWDLSFFFENKDENLKVLNKRLSSCYIPIDDEMEYGIRWIYQTSMMGLALEFLVGLVPSINQIEFFSEIDKEEFVILSVGEYMHKQTDLLRLK